MADSTHWPEPVQTWMLLPLHRYRPGVHGSPGYVVLHWATAPAAARRTTVVMLWVRCILVVVGWNLGCIDDMESGLEPNGGLIELYITVK